MKKITQVTVNKKYYDELLETARKYKRVEEGFELAINALKRDMHELFRENLDLRTKLGMEPSISTKVLAILGEEW